MLRANKTYVRGEIGTLGCVASPNLYGEGLNRITRVSASALHVKPLHNIVEANITWETSGSERDKQLSNVFVLDTNKRPLDPVNPGKARIMLTRGEAAVYRRYPFTIILRVAIDNPEVSDLRIKLVPPLITKPPFFRLHLEGGPLRCA
ncbi:MAG TPA: RRXRR domain-containing protein [Ktedonobacteraceae bacterium]|nr:RRXRR domain-containing protein [Ktedonobacteraceae bacterium]